MSDLRFEDVVVHERLGTIGRRERDGTKRYKLRFGDQATMDAVLAVESPMDVVVASRKRLTMSVNLPENMGQSLEATGMWSMMPPGVEIVEDFQYDLEEVDFFNPGELGPDDVTQPSLDDVVMQIGARDAWQYSRGADVIIAIVDTGVDGTRPEFSQGKRFQGWAPNGDDPWVDHLGHGTMCATIAAGTAAQGGVFDGVAPDAKIMPCRTYFYDTELADIYDRLTALARDGHTVVASNSFGLKTGTPPPLPQGSDFPDALQQALDAGVIAFFSAGNYHHLAGGVADGHAPNTIWLHKGREDVMTIGAARPDQTMWYYSSRGPGQFYGQANTSEKPDIVGITPPNGRIVYGGNIRTLSDGWGTSGCCPQAAGLAALMLAKRASQGGAPLLRNDVFDIIRSTSTPVGHHRRAGGLGIINCLAAVQAV